MPESPSILKYSDAAHLVDDHLKLHKGENFTLDDMSKWCVAISSQGRKWVATRLGELVDQEILEKNGSFRGAIYKYVNRDIKYITYSNNNPNDILPLNWPYDRETGSRFGFDGNLVIRSGDLIVLAGLSGEGKSTFCRNTASENIDGPTPVIMMVNEYAPARFADILDRMGWVDWYNEDGSGRLTLIERHEDWKYAIHPDCINIIDWISLDGDRAFDIGKVLEGIKTSLKKGIAIVALQKREGKVLGVGGGYSEELSQVYFLIDKGTLTVRKCTDWRNVNPKNSVYGFSITDYGARFSNIRVVKLCPRCGDRNGGTVYDRESGGYIKCPKCYGIGYVDRVDKEVING